MEVAKPRKASRYTWSNEDAALLKEYYGKIAISDICKILDKTLFSVRGQVWRKEIKAHSRQYGTIVIKHRDKLHTIKNERPRYITTITPEGKRICRDTQRQSVAKPKLPKVKKKKEPKPKVEVVVKPFEKPAEKKLVLIAPKTWAYR